ncbi:alpha/beta fold hydrolase [Xylophilus sp. GW821-FHT01B05]
MDLRWGRYGSWLAGLMVALLLGGCAGVKVSSIEMKDYVALRRGDVLSTGKISYAAQEALQVIGLDGKACAADLPGCRQALAASSGLDDERRLSTLSELWLQTAIAPPAEQQAPPLRMAAYLEAARHAYAYLFFTTRRPGERAFEERQTQVRDYYNFAVQQISTLLFNMSMHPDGRPEEVAGWRISVRLEDMYLPGTQDLPRELIPASSLTFAGIRNMYRRDGFGTELVAVTTVATRAEDGKDLPYRESEFPAISAIALFAGNSLPEVLATHDVAMVGYDPYRRAAVDVAGTQVPLAANFTSGYGLWLARSGFATQAVRNFLGGARGLQAPHIYLMQPYDPKRRIVLMLHGLASSPEAWINVANEVMGDEALRQNFQIWQVYYPTNAPLAYNREEIRSALQQTLKHFDPDGTAPASRHIVLVGHSMGGVLARLLMSSSGDGLWDSFLKDNPMDSEQLERARTRVGPYLRFDPLQDVGRVIFIAAPHRGTPLAENRVARWVSNLVTLPLGIAERVADVYATRPGQSQSSQPAPLLRIPNSIDNLSDKDDFVRLAATLPMAPVPFHSIIGNDEPGVPLAESSDGIVPYSSAHLDGAQSELIVSSSHSVQESPAAILEIRRILREDLQGAPVGR